jgi:transmembrane sensor
MDSEARKSERIEELASRWFARRQSAAWTDVDQATFDAWIEEHPAHRIAYIRLDAAWKEAARLKALGAGVPPGVIPPRRSWGDTRFSSPTSAQTPETQSAPAITEGELSPSPRESRGGRRRVWPLTLAASVALALVGGLYVYSTSLLPGTRYSTRVGAMDTVPLADGSHVTLNTDSRIRVALEAKERRVDLDRGEAFFDVAKDPARPFIVQAGDKRVVAVGTQFSVRRDHDDIRVAVTEGRVRVEDASSPVVLTAGSVAQTANTEVLVHEAAGAEVEELLSWRTGYVVFRDTALADAVAEFNRYNTRKIIIEDPTIAAIRIGGNFRSNNTDAFLWLLQSGFPVTVEETHDQVVLKRRP